MDGLVSLCCSAPVTVLGHTTRYHSCQRCGMPCDATTRAQDEAWHALAALGDELQGQAEACSPGPAGEG
jgi:hypothetical protein